MEQETIELSSEQQFAADKMAEFLDHFPDTKRPYFVLEGYAGTGKSFCINKIINDLGLRAKYMAYTGKAALVLQKYSGVDAATIHSTIYRVRQVSDNTFKALYAQMDAEQDEEKKRCIRDQIEELKQPQFELNPEAFEEDRPDVLILDECSMVDDSLLHDLVSFDIPIIALGDPGQLPPVKGEGALFKGMADARLTEIRRQALDNPGIKWSMWARQRRQLPATDKDNMLTDPVAKVGIGLLTDAELVAAADSHDIMICWRNATRKYLNQWRRRTLGLNTGGEVYPVVGDLLQIQKNDKKLGIFNGMFCTVVEVGDLHEHFIDLHVRTEMMDEDATPLKLHAFRYTFEEYNDPDIMKTVRPWFYRDTQVVDFGYAITCHKAQGSQWPRVLVWDEDVFDWFKGDAPQKRAEWIYTAVTRFVEKVTIIKGRVNS